MELKNSKNLDCCATPSTHYQILQVVLLSKYDEANQDLFAAYGIIPKDKSVDTTLKPKYCPNCNSPNQPEQHYCMSCGFVLTLTGYSKLMEQQQIKDKQIEAMMRKQEQFEQLIQSLIDSGQLKPTST